MYSGCGSSSYIRMPAVAAVIVNCVAMADSNQQDFAIVFFDLQRAECAPKTEPCVRLSSEPLGRWKKQLKLFKVK